MSAQPTAPRIVAEDPRSITPDRPGAETSAGDPLYDFVNDPPNLLMYACQARRLTVPVTDEARGLLTWFPDHHRTVKLAGVVQCAQS